MIGERAKLASSPSLRRWLALVAAAIAAHVLLDRLALGRGPFAATGRLYVEVATLTAIACILRWIVLVGAPARLAWAGVAFAWKRLARDDRGARDDQAKSTP